MLDFFKQKIISFIRAIKISMMQLPISNREKMSLLVPHLTIAQQFFLSFNTTIYMAL